MCHIGTDVVAHSFVNEQCGGPLRTHHQRHHVIENHMDAHNYRACAPGGSVPADPMGATETFPDIDSSALVFSVALDDAHPHGWPRPTTLSDEPDEAKKQVDVEGEMPDWLADGIVRAMIATYHEKTGHLEPANLGGGPFQAGLSDAQGGVRCLIDKAGIGIDRPLSELFAMIAPDPDPDPDPDVPPGYPLPWEVKVGCRFMISFYKLSFTDGFDLKKPRTPKVISWPPVSDLTDLASAPDFSGASTGDPVEDLCNAIKALVDWIKKVAEAALKLAGDIIKALASPFTYPLRAGLHERAMLGWNIASGAHEILAHTGFVYPHGERLCDDGELAVPNEIDLALITLGMTTDAAFVAALGDASDILGNLDLATDGLGDLRDPQQPFPYLPVLEVQDHGHKPNEHRRPWAFPSQGRGPDGNLYDTSLEQWDAGAEMDQLGLGRATRAGFDRLLGDSKGLTVPGPYRAGSQPESLLTGGHLGDPQQRPQYEAAYTPAITDALNRQHLILSDGGGNPLGDVIPFSSDLIGRILSKDGYPVDFNLDADRGYGNLCWDWTRDPNKTATNGLGQTLTQPVIPPEGSTTDGSGSPWLGAVVNGNGQLQQQKLQLQYFDKQPPGGQTWGQR